MSQTDNEANTEPVPGLVHYNSHQSVPRAEIIRSTYVAECAGWLVHPARHSLSCSRA